MNAITRMGASLAELKHRNFLLYYLTARDFKVKYRHSFLGVAWSVLNPLLMMIVLSLVFSHIFRFDIENFALYLILGNTIFSFMTDGTSTAMGSVTGNAALIKKVYIPKYIFPLEKVLFALVNFAVSLIAVVIVMVFSRVVPTPHLFMIVPLLIYVFIFTLGVGILLSALAVFFRDIVHLWGVVLTAWTYLTPLFYPVTILPEVLQKAMLFNPMYHYVTYFREIALYHTMPGLMENGICIGFGVVMLVIGLIVFKKTQDKFILHI